MLDLTQFAIVLAAVAGVSGAVALFGAWPRPVKPPARVPAAWMLGLVAGLFVGCWLLGSWPHWPAREDQGRLLFIVIPLILVVELLAAFLGRLRVLVWGLRWMIAIKIAEILLHNTTYLTDLAGPGSREWSSWQKVMILSSLTVALGIVWVPLVLLSRFRAVPLALALNCAGAGVVVMLSGYASGGQIGLLLGAALVGVTAASLAWPGLADFRGVVSVGIVGLFSVLVIGLFFGQLTRTHAIMLFFAPLLCWVSRVQGVRNLRPWLGGAAQIALVAVPVTIAVVQARQRFLEESMGSFG